MVASANDKPTTTAKDGSGNGKILHTGPDSTKRDHGTVYVSLDDGATWPVKRELWPGGFAYSVPTRLADGTVGVIYVDTTTPLTETAELGGRRFSDEHLKLMVAIGHQAALAVEDTTYYSAMVQSERLAAVAPAITAKLAIDVTPTVANRHQPFVAVWITDTTGKHVRTLAFWAGDRFEPNFEYAIAHTPCELVLAGELYHCAEKVADQFPLHRKELEEIRVESYLAIPVTSASGQVLGHLAVMDTKRMELAQLDLSVFKVFGTRAGAELERLLMERQLKDNEARLRDLFDEAPIAYVNEGLDSKFIQANKTALKTLGITAEEVDGTYGKSFIPDTPDAQRRLKEAFDSIGKGIDTSGVILELRRKDNGKPLWIRWWSRPDPSGAYTRTMFVDITEQVLMEQEKARLEAQAVYLQEEIKGSHNFEELIGASTSLKKVLKNVERVAPTDSTVLIHGETGTGKELIARAIDNLSPRKSKPLVKVNCAAIPAGLIESELFGHEKGAFTGALTRKLGRFEVADKGTIFLDEIGELPLDLQSKLLRVLQEGEFERVGGTQTFKVNVRIIAATNRDLDSLSKSGQYRPDLYYRLNVFPIHLPPLREREGDLPLLVQYFVRKFATNFGKKITKIPERIMTALQRYPWPGNIRELEHVVERAVILSEGPELEPID